MALIDDEPPTMRPRAHSRPRPPVKTSGSAKYIQSCLRWSRRRGQPSGILIHGSRSQPPASSSSTRLPLSSLSRLASAQPAEPAPTMMVS